MALQWTNHLHHPPAHAHRHSQPDADAMTLVSQNLESSEQFLAHFLRLDTDGPMPLTIKTLAGDIISWLNETVHNCEEQVRKLLKYKCKFQRIAAEVGGADMLANLEVCHAYACRPTRPAIRRLQQCHVPTPSHYTNGGLLYCEPPLGIFGSKDEGIPMGVCVWV